MKSRLSFILLCLGLVVEPLPVGYAAEAPSPLVSKDKAVNWWFVFKFNSASFPACANDAKPSCPFGGKPQKYGKSFSQQYIYASKDEPALQDGSGCLGDTHEDPVGSTFDKIYFGSYHYVVWNDQFYLNPPIEGCAKSCGGSWGHSKGILAWNDEGEGIVMQVTTPNWPGAGSKRVPRPENGNTLGCITQSDQPQNNIKVSQHFFSVKLSRDGVLAVINALENASVVTDTKNHQVFSNGGPVDISAAASNLGQRSTSTKVLQQELAPGIQLISKPSRVRVPPWQMLSAVLDGVSLRVASWWEANRPELAIPPTNANTRITCWHASLGKPGRVEIAKTGRWGDQEFGLTGGPGPDYNHAKIGVSISGNRPYSIFADMNQEGTLSGPNDKCGKSQNGRGGYFSSWKTPSCIGA
jgi:hypothetical protein